MLIPLSEASRSSCGGKAATLCLLLRERLPVPDGFVVPPAGGGARAEGGRALRSAVARELERLGDPVVAVRSSAAMEDTADASAAGQYESVIGVQGAGAVCEAIAACRASARAARVDDYWRRTSGHASRGESDMAVLVQSMVVADVSGVMFTPTRPQDPLRIEAAWGLGLALVGGTVTPDAYEVTPDGESTSTTGRKLIRIDVVSERPGLTTRAVSDDQRAARTLEEPMVAALARLGHRIAGLLGRPQDVEWAVADGSAWILQARPITADLPGLGATAPDAPSGAIAGVPGAHGVVTAAARIVRGPSDFSALRPGEILVCPYTSPAWTPLFTVASGVVSETGGALSHAAIVAREYGIPAALGIANATTRIATGDRITLDGTSGTVRLPGSSGTPSTPRRSAGSISTARTPR